MGPESLAGQWLQMGRLTEAFRTEGRAGEVTGVGFTESVSGSGEGFPLCV